MIPSYCTQFLDIECTEEHCCLNQTTEKKEMEVKEET